VERGLYLGGEQFRQELLEQVETRPRPSHFGKTVEETETAQAERLVLEAVLTRVTGTGLPITVTDTGVTPSFAFKMMLTPEPVSSYYRVQVQLQTIISG